MGGVIASINFPPEVHQMLIDLQKHEASETLRKVSASKIVSRLVKREYEKVKNHNGIHEPQKEESPEQDDSAGTGTQ